MPSKTMFKKIWDNHVVRELQGEATVLYIDTHLIHEVTSPQAFEGLRLANRGVRRPSQTFATMDHNVPTTDRSLPITDLISKKQMETLTKNCEEFGIRLYDLHHSDQGIVHVLGPELGLTQPGMTIVCGDSHTSTHGAFGALAFGIAPDDKTYEYVAGREFSPKGEEFDKAVATWKKLPTDSGATYDHSITLSAEDLVPQVTWGTNPEMVVNVTETVPDPDKMPTQHQKKAAENALVYMGLRPNTPITQIAIDKVFIGSCTNSRITDLRVAAEVAKDRKVSSGVNAIVVPGSQAVKRQAEAEGLDKVFRAAGFEWREAGCSMCLAMNDDVLQPGERCASTSNRNFEGRQGKDGRTHLVSPQMAAAAAIEGKFVDVRTWGN